MAESCIDVRPKGALLGAKEPLGQSNRPSRTDHGERMLLTRTLIEAQKPKAWKISIMVIVMVCEEQVADRRGIKPQLIHARRSARPTVKE